MCNPSRLKRQVGLVEVEQTSIFRPSEIVEAARFPQPQTPMQSPARSKLIDVGAMSTPKLRVGLRRLGEDL
jgi:hypothetical protein